MGIGLGLLAFGYVCMFVQQSEEGVQSFGSAVTGSCELPVMGAEIQI